MKLRIRREENYKDKRYTMLEFKGKFESDLEDNKKCLLHLGMLKEIGDNKYNLEIGVMDLKG